MKAFIFSVILTGFSFIILSNSVMANDCDEFCQLEQVNAYFSALDKVAKKGSTSSDVDALLDLTHDDVKYVHVQYEANFTKDSWRKAFLRNIELSRYQKTDKNQIRILNSIAGKNHLAIEYSHGFIQENGDWEKTEKYLAIFGFTDGRLSLIKELW
jgi:hypothetical protein